MKLSLFSWSWNDCEGRQLSHSQIMWSKEDVCSPVAFNVVPFADNPVEIARIVANNVVRKWPMFAVQRADVCGPLQLQHRRQFAPILIYCESKRTDGRK